MVPELRRDIIRLANRERMTAEDIMDIINLSDMLLVRVQSPEDAELVTAEHIISFWKESFE